MGMRRPGASQWTSSGPAGTDAATPVTLPAQPSRVGAGRTERPSWTPRATIIKPWPKQGLSEHVRAAPTPPGPRPSREEAEAAVRTLIAYTGDDPEREGVLETPKRVIDAYEEIYQGYRECPAEVLDRTFSEIGGYDDFVLVKDIRFYSHCEHHMMPFFGKAHIAYMPTERVVGLSKLARLRRRLRAAPADAGASHLADRRPRSTRSSNPRGVAVMIEAEHMCMSLRGVEKHGALTVTTHFTGAFRDDANEQVRFMTMLRGAQR